MRKKRTEREQNKSIVMADMSLKNLALQFSNPIIEPDFYIPADLRLDEETEPSIFWVENSPLDWEKSSEAGMSPTPPAAEECLSQFCRLRNATDAEILKFATRWGTLGICPTKTSTSYEIPTSLTGVYWCTSYSEPTQLWRDVAGRAWGMLLVAAELMKNERAFREDWQQVVDFRCWHFRQGGFWQRQMGCSLPYSTFSKGERLAWDIEWQRRLLEQCVMEWLNQVQVRPVLHWKSGENGAICPRIGFAVNRVILSDDYGYNPLAYQSSWRKGLDAKLGNPEFRFDVRDPSDYQRYELRPSPLFHAIVLQLIAAMMSPLYRCAICGAVFNIEDRRGRGRAGGRHICKSVACKAQAHLDNANAYNERKSQAKQSAQPD